MKKSLIAFAVLLTLGAFTWADEILHKLGLSEQTARYYIMADLTGSFSSGFEEGVGEDGGSYMEQRNFRLPSLRNLKTIVSGDKVGLARDACAYVKLYLSSKEFAEEYQKKREACRPTSEPWRPDAATLQQQKDGLKEMEKAVAEMKKGKQMSADMIKQMEDGIVMQRKQIEESEDPTPNKTKWEKDFPADPALLVKRRLEEYLKLSETVDFKATLTSGKKFVNPEYEKKSLKWKAIYRAGSEVNGVVRNFASGWLKDGIKIGSTTMPVEKESSSIKATEKRENNVEQEKEKPSTVEEAKSTEKKGGLKSLKNKAKGLLN